jgi:uncharacterized phage protein gp47/JayE
VLDIARLEGRVNGAPFVFRKGTDYRLRGGMLEWLADGERPDDRSPFFVNYTLDAPSDITDINPGSVIRTIVESVALEMDFLYAQMNQVYISGFIDTATGKSLDLVVSLLGITRKPAGYATGEVTFGRAGDPGEVQVAREAHIYNGQRAYYLKNAAAKGLVKIDGTSGGAEKSFEEGKDYILAEGAVVWTAGGSRPDEGSAFYADYIAHEQITIPADARVSTYSRQPENVKVFRTLRESALARKPDGRWEAEVPVVAMSPGKTGNVFAGSISVMPKPLMGIEYVINKKDIMNGTEEENDPDLRERAKSALEAAGKATLGSLRSAVQGVPGVIGEVKVVDQPDGVPGVVQIIVSGGDSKEIERIINETRSAGIKVEFKPPRIVPLDVSLTVFLVEGVDAEDVRKGVDSAIRQHLGSLNIDEDVILSQIINSALSVQGIRDVRDVTINGLKDNVDVGADEKAELRTLEIFLEG